MNIIILFSKVIFVGIILAAIPYGNEESLHSIHYFIDVLILTMTFMTMLLSMTSFD